MRKSLSRPSRPICPVPFDSLLVELHRIARTDEPKWTTIRHASQTDRIIVLRERELEVEFEEGVFRVLPGDVLCCPATVQMKGLAVPGAGVSADQAHFDLFIDDQRRLFREYPPPRCVRGSSAERVADLMGAAMRRLQDRSPWTWLRASDELLKMVASLYEAPAAQRLGHTRQTVAVRPAIAARDTNFVHTLTFRMRDAVARGEPVSVAELAKRSGLSRSRMNSVFRRTVGVPPAAYLRQIRLHAARRQLEQEAVTIRAAAAAVGFLDPYHFSRAFHEMFGISPSEYQRRYHRQSE